MTPEYALEQHLTEFDQFERNQAFESEPEIIQCAVCGGEGIQGKQIYFDLKLMQWQCRDSFPCEAEGVLIEQTVERIEEILEMEIATI